MRRILLSVFTLLPIVGVAQGTLTPPGGAPAPNMKSLDQIYNAVVAPAPDAQRIPIRAADLPLVINEPGSYYLTEDAHVATDNHGITIAADHVTLDLNGYRLRGPGKSFQSANNASAVRVNGTHSVVRNGHILDWPDAGVYTDSGQSHTAANLTVKDAGGHGLRMGFGGRIEGCNVWGADAGGVSVGEYGIIRATTVSSCGAAIHSNAMVAGHGSVVVDCVARENGGIGIAIGPGARVSNCASRFNGSDGFQASFGADAATFDGCVAQGNSGDGFEVGHRAMVTRCHATSNSGAGIRASGNHVLISDSMISVNFSDGLSASDANGGSVTNCVFNQNALDGIDVGTAWIVRANTLFQNGSGQGVTDGAGVRVGSNCHVSENHCVSNDVGIAAANNSSYFTQNTLRSNTTQKSLAGSAEGAGVLANVAW